MKKIRKYIIPTVLVISLLTNAWLCFAMVDTSITLHYARAQISFLEKDISVARDIIEDSFKNKGADKVRDLGIKLQAKEILYKDHSLSEAEISIGEWAFVIKDDKVVSVRKD